MQSAIVHFVSPLDHYTIADRSLVPDSFTRPLNIASFFLQILLLKEVQKLFYLIICLARAGTFFVPVYNIAY